MFGGRLEQGVFIANSRQLEMGGNFVTVCRDLQLLVSLVIIPAHGVGQGEIVPDTVVPFIQQQSFLASLDSGFMVSLKSQ